LSRRRTTKNSLVAPGTILTVSQVTELVKVALETAVPEIWVEGEVSNFHRHTSGHLYFTLKDARSQLRAVMFSFAARRNAFDLKDGLKVVCRGRLNVYEPRGEYQIVVELVEPKGKGALQLAFEQLKEKLRAEGLFDPARKRPLPLRPGTIGIVTSPRGAAIADILRVLERRYARLRIVIYPVKVQGEGAAAEIVEGIDRLGAMGGIDVMIVGRGGGSIEDLWAFNEEPVARAIARSPVPVISAVGHEIDFTIADFVADVRAPTPSAAAELVIETEAAFAERIASLAERASRAVASLLHERRSLVATMADHRVFEGFRVRLLNLAQRVDDLDGRAAAVLRAGRQALAERRASSVLAGERLRNLMAARLRELGARWENLSVGLHANSPLNILGKGYTLCWKEEGFRLLRAPGEAAPGEGIVVSFVRGELACDVKRVDADRTIESRLEKEGS
jgi:exodeoxyribonuclease VII large subunit